MDYKEKYERALEYMCKVYPTLNAADKVDAEHYFPELKESEDERVRKALLSEFISLQSKGYKFAGLEGEDIINWLEKPGEQNSVKWHSEDEQSLNACLGYIPDEFLRRWLKNVIHVKYDKPADTEWNWEDEIRLTNIIIMLKEGASHHFIKDDITKAVDWLKFLRKRMKGE